MRAMSVASAPPRPTAWAWPGSPTSTTLRRLLRVKRSNAVREGVSKAFALSTTRMVLWRRRGRRAFIACARLSKLRLSRPVSCCSWWAACPLGATPSTVYPPIRQASGDPHRVGFAAARPACENLEVAPGSA